MNTVMSLLKSRIRTSKTNNKIVGVSIMGNDIMTFLSRMTCILINTKLPNHQYQNIILNIYIYISYRWNIAKMFKKITNG